MKRFKGIITVLLVVCLLSACSSDEEKNDVVVNSKLLIGEWEASHHSKNHNYGDTADMWKFTFNSDGTGSGPYGTKDFRYEVNEDRITLHLLNIEAYYGQTEFYYKIVSISKDRMEWDEIPNEYGSDNSLYLKFYRKE